MCLEFKKLKLQSSKTYLIIVVLILISYWSSFNCCANTSFKGVLLYNNKSLDNQNDSSEINHAHALDELVEKKGLLVDYIRKEDIGIKLPVGIRRSLGGIDYTIVFDSLIVTPRRAVIVAYMSLKTPQGKRLAFKGRVNFTSRGGFEGVGRTGPN